MAEIEKYDVVSEKISVEVRISHEPGDYVKTYSVSTPRYPDGTRALLDALKEDIRAETAIRIGKLTTSDEIEKLKAKFSQRVADVIESESLPVGEKERAVVIGTILQEMLGLGPLEFLLNDAHLEEIVVNGSSDPVWVYHRTHGWLKTSIRIKREPEILNYASIVARRVGRQINVLDPLLDAHLLTGERVNATLFPVSSHGHTMTIRKSKKDPWTVVDLIANNTVSSDVMALVWMAMQYELNIIISGGTASGKTSFLNTLMPFIQPNHRVISIEDTRELQLPEFMHWVPMVTREPNAEGKGGVQMLDLLVNSLRMRPDRVVVGEIRRQREAEVLFEAMHTGHSVYSTIHADTAQQTIRRITNAPISIPMNLLESVHLNIVMFRNRRTGYRRVLQLAEFVPSGEQGFESVAANVLYRWKPGIDKVEFHSEGIRFFDDLALHTAFGKNEIKQDIETRKNILEWLVKNKTRDILNVGKILAHYYLDKDSVIAAAEKNKKPESIL
ncbi:MAG TPA: ATPase, T2SS/T4P/T4SS family [archaeon]|nr:ATPase, T2SS/T4P/T4SS family [archaeon]